MTGVRLVVPVALLLTLLPARGSAEEHVRADATFTALELARHADEPTLLLFSDGLDAASWIDGAAVVQQVRRSEVVVNVVTPGRGPAPDPGRRAGEPVLRPSQLRDWFLQPPVLFREQFLQVLANQTGGEVFRVSASRDLRVAFVRIVATFRSRYLLTYTPSAAPDHDWHPIEVRLRRAKADIRARPGYMR